MSDSVKDLIKRYEKDVLHGLQSNRGLSPILEEHQDQVEVKHGMWSEALDVLLTTLRYLAPATLLTLFWGQQSFLFRLLNGIDSSFRAIVFSSEEQKQEVLQWLSSVGPQRIERLDTVWHHGWVLCSILDAALPGACAGHPVTRLSLKHAQAIADHYLGVEPVFSRHELESTESLSRNQEWKLATYLSRIKEALSKLTPLVTQPVSQRTSPETTEFMMDYVAKGSGLKAAQVNNKMYFKIYPATQQSLDPGEITILIRGPKDTYGMSVLSPIYGKAQAIRQELLGLDNTKNYTENALPISQGATYLRAYGKNDMTKTFHIPKRNYDIEIEATPRNDYIKIGYTVTLQGKYEIFITSKGQHIVGSPFLMKASNNIIGTLERESYCLEDGEEIGIDMGTEKKVVLRIVDFVTEKMLLRDNGSLEKISDDEAEKLLMTDKSNDYVTDHDCRSCSATSWDTDVEEKSKKFNKVATNVARINRVFKAFDKVTSDKRLKAMKKEQSFKLSNKLIVPDIVNSTFTDSKSNPFYLSVNEDVSVPFKRERSKSFGDIISQIIGESDTPEKVVETQDSLEEYKVFEGQEDPLRTVSSSSSSNPFLNDIYEEKFEKDLRTFVKTEFETNNSQIEETPDMPIKIVIEESSKAPSPVNNPFIEIEEFKHMDRPKTPVLKIIKGEVEPRDVSVYVSKHAELLEEELLAHESLANEFLNPFFILQQKIVDKPIPVTDFIIGAPVSLPPILRANTPDSEIDSLVVTSQPENSTIDVIEDYMTKEDRSFDSNISPEYSTPLCYNVKVPETLKVEHPVLVSSTFHSMDSIFTDNVEGSSISNVSDNHKSYQIVSPKSDRNVSKKDMWDSAYVSIDESNSSPDNNNNDNRSNDSPKSKMYPSDDFSNMGPAEKEMWLTCNDLRDPISTSDNSTISKADVKENFTPILEEINKKSSAKNIEIRKPILNRSNDSSISKTDVKEKFTPILQEIDKKSTKNIDTQSDSKTTEPKIYVNPVTFAELNTNLYVECLKTESNVINKPAVTENNKTYKEDKPQVERRESVDKLQVERRDSVDKLQVERQESVDSASVVSDVKRHAKRLEGKISEVQANVTESGSVSQTLHPPFNNSKLSIEKDNDQFECKNIVLIKKNYWDERIQEIEEKTQKEEIKEKKRRLTTRNLLQNDSLTKKRAKEVANNVLGKDKQLIKAKSMITSKIIKEEPLQRTLTEVEQADSRLVEKWRRYWDTKLESDNENETKCFKTKHPKFTERNSTLSKSLPKHASSENLIEDYKEKSDRKKERPKTPMPEKEEMPEEVFKAFETSPKRFFGTSRKQIFNKIDSFLERQSTANSSSTDASGASPDTGLVSSRISLFHTISNTEEPSWVRRKCQSINNVSRRKFSDSSVSSKSSNDDRDNDHEWKTKLFTQTMSLVPTVQNKYESETNEINKINVKEIPEENYILSEPEHIPLKEKRARLVQRVYKNIEKRPNETPIPIRRPKVAKVSPIKNAFNDIQRDIQVQQQNNLRKSIVSKSEMDIFNKTTNNDNYDLDMRKSYEELPKINVKNFISLYESVEEKEKPFKCQKQFESSSCLGAAKPTTRHLSKQQTNTPHVTHQNQTKENWRNKSYESVSSTSVEPKSLDSNDLENSPQPERDTTYISFSDIELEIVPLENSADAAVNINENLSTDYKSRFKMAKQYFQSLEELPPVKKPRKLNECQVLLIKSSTESLDYQPRKPRRLRSNKKSNSLPSSELSKIWNQLQEDSNSKLMKISEKFNVEDLFSDVTEGKLSRQGSLRGIPHKKAVLEAFRSMESLVPNKTSAYEMAVTQLNDFAKENQVKNAQTYLSEYPYLPTTDPSKYQSRLDPKAQGLISLKELKQKRRRNSTPDLRLSATFAVNL